MKPKFEISKKIALEKFKELENISDIISYSSKTNPIISNILEDNTNCWFSIHSINELKNIKDKSRILFLAQGWNKEEINHLIKEGIKKFAVDNNSDLEELKKYLKQNDTTQIELFLRLKLKENTLKTEKYFVFGFNSDFINEEIPKLKSSNQIKKIGIHFHRKTQNIAEWSLKKEIEDTLSNNTLESLNYMIIGGGLPSIYANTNTKIFNGIFQKIKEFKDYTNSFGCKMIIEPGRYIAAPAGKLISHIKCIHNNNIILDVSVYNSDLDALIVPVKLLVKGEVSKDEGKPYVIKGITPCSMDLFRYRVYLKNEPKIGDQLTFLNAGAYNFTSDFCDLEKIETIIN